MKIETWLFGSGIFFFTPIGIVYGWLSGWEAVGTVALLLTAAYGRLTWRNFQDALIKTLDLEFGDRILDTMRHAWTALHRDDAVPLAIDNLFHVAEQAV